jgi:hypothetical protein
MKVNKKIEADTAKNGQRRLIWCYVLHGTGVSIGNLVYTLKISLIGVTNEY